MSPARVAAKVAEDDPVRRWRCEQLERAGYPPGVALALSARTDIDLHRAIDLVRNGCPVATAIRILR